MRCNPAVPFDRAPVRTPRISVLLLDWGVRQSFHALHYLAHQTAPRDHYEILWLEFYDRRPDELHRLVSRAHPSFPLLDRWIVLGYPDSVLFHKHRLYNVGFLAASGDVCVICDSDAIFPPTFIENLIRAFEETPHAVIHLDEVRNEDPRFYPFAYPTTDEIVGLGCINWHACARPAFAAAPDPIHRANLGACMAARRRDILAVGGADEHLDYLGYVCGPYDLTFRLANHHSQPERWLHDVHLYHVWHPNTSGANTDYQGPHDGRFVSLRALDARARHRIAPHLQSPLMSSPWKRGRDLEAMLAFLAQRPEPDWVAGNQPPLPPEDVYWVVRDHHLGFNVFCHRQRWFALPVDDGLFDPRRHEQGGYPRIVQASDQETLEGILCEQVAAPVAPPGRLGQLMRSFRTRPLSHWPGRIWRKARRMVSGVRPGRSPWTVATRHDEATTEKEIRS